MIQVSRMAWRVITPSDVHDSILNESTESSQGKRRKSSGRKKSSKSESEHEVYNPGNVQENSLAEGWSKSGRGGGIHWGADL